MDHSALAPLVFALVMLMLMTPFVIFTIVCVWKVFTKAGQPGWASLVPIYNAYIWLKVANRPGWWLLLFLIPLVNIVIAILTKIDVAKAFGKGGGFAVVLILLPIIGLPILAFGNCVYTQPQHT